MKVIIFPENYFIENTPFEDFDEDFEAAVYAGFSPIFLTDDFRLKFHRTDKISKVGIYKGWMLNLEQYARLYLMAADKFDITLLSTPSSYRRSHWGYQIHEFHREYKTIVLEDHDLSYGNIQKVINFFEGEDFIIKDHVKSSGSPFFFRVFSDSDVSEVVHAINGLKKERGDAYTGGIVFKQYIDLERDSDGRPNEWRAFYFKGKLISLDKRHQDSDFTAIPPESKLASLSNYDSTFYTVDLAEGRDGKFYVIESGAGEVSDYTGKNYYSFYKKLYDLM